MGLASSSLVPLPDVVHSFGTWSLDKVDRIIGVFFSENFQFSLSIHDVVKLIGVSTKEAKELRSFLSDKRINNVNSTSLLVVIILLAARHEMTQRQRQLAIFRLIDHKRIGTISANGLEILLYRVSMACARILGAVSFKSSHIKHLQKMIFRDFHKRKEDVMTEDEFMTWSDEVVRGGDRINKRDGGSGVMGMVFNSVTGAWCWDGIQHSHSVQDIYEYFSNFSSIFEKAISSAKQKIEEIEEKFKNEMDVLSLNDSSSKEDKERGVCLEKEKDVAVRQVKAEAQLSAAIRIESLGRHRHQVYCSLVAMEKAMLRRVAAVEAVRMEATAVSEAVSCLNSLGHYRTMMKQEICHIETQSNDLINSEKSITLSGNIDKVVDIISQLNFRRSLLSEKLAVISSELRFSMGTLESLKKERKELILGTLSTKSTVVLDIQLNRVDAKLELVNSERQRLMELLNACALDSGGLMSDQIRLEQQLDKLKVSRVALDKQIEARKSCLLFLTEKLAKVESMLETEKWPATADSCDDNVEMSKGLVSKIKMRSSGAVVGVIERAPVFIETKGCEYRQSSGGKLMLKGDVNNTQVVATASKTTLLTVATATENNITCMDENETDVNKAQGRFLHQQACEEMAMLEQSKRDIIDDIDTAKLTVSQLNSQITESQARIKQATEDSEAQIKISEAKLKSVLGEVRAAERQAAAIRQQAEETRLRVDKENWKSREEIAQLRRNQEAAEAQVEAVVEMTENMIVEAEQEKERLMGERQVALDAAQEAMKKVALLEAEVLSLRNVNDHSSQQRRIVSDNADEDEASTRDWNEGCDDADADDDDDDDDGDKNQEAVLQERVIVTSVIIADA